MSDELIKDGKWNPVIRRSDLQESGSGGCFAAFMGLLFFLVVFAVFSDSLLRIKAIEKAMGIDRKPLEMVLKEFRQK